MSTRTTPQGAAALHPDWPEARFNLSGMFGLHPVILQLIKVVERAFGCRLPIEAIHGAPDMPWNGGRWSRMPFNPAEFATVLNFLHSRNIGFYATFTNNHITSDDLSHPLGNQLLEIINQRPDLNGVIITSELLSQYISRKYPAIRQIASITKVEFEKGVGRVEYYRELGKRFHRYVVHSDDCCKPQLLGQLDREKAEIIVNENCVRNCPQRFHHFDTIARLQRAQTPAEQQKWMQEINAIMSRCPQPAHLHRIGEHALSCNLSCDEMKAVYDLGFRHFKLQGRGDDPQSYAYDLTRFMLEPEVAAPQAAKVILRWLEQVLAMASGK